MSVTENIEIAAPTAHAVGPADAPDVHGQIDAIECAMLDSGDLIDCPLVHTFTPGMYIRTIFMPAGSLVTSKIHKHEHPYSILQGRVRVFIPGVGVQELAAPFMGVTEPGTRRVLFILEDTVWATYHLNPTNTTDLVELEDELIEQRYLPDGSRAHDYYLAGLNEQLLDEPPVQLDYGGAP